MSDSRLSDYRTLNAYVRLGATKDSRLISLSFPPLSQPEALAMGFAIDGDALIFEVAPYIDVVEDEAAPYARYACLELAGDGQHGGHVHYDLADGLRCTQRTLIEVFEKRGCSVTFQ